MIQNSIYQQPQGKLIRRVSLVVVPEVVITDITAKNLIVQLTTLTGTGGTGGSSYTLSLSDDNGATYLNTLTAGANLLGNSGSISSLSSGTGLTEVVLAGTTASTSPEQRPYSGSVFISLFGEPRPSSFAGNFIGRINQPQRVVCWGVETSGAALNAIRLKLDGGGNLRATVTLFDIG